MNKDEFTTKIKTLEREVLELKTAQQLSPNVQGYFWHSTGTLIGRYRIDYADGNTEIITENLTYSTASSTPSGNTQYFWVFGTVVPEIYLLSTRQILAVTSDPE